LISSFDIKNMSADSLKGSVLPIDIETSGNDPLTNDLLAFGAAAMRIENKEVVSKFKVYIKPKTGTIRWDPSTLKFWNKNMEVKNAMLDKVNGNAGMTRRDAARAFVNWITEFGSEFNKTNTIITDTACFDPKFIDDLLVEWGYMPLNYIFGEYRPTFDTTSFHRGVGHMLYSDGMWGAETAACAKLGLPDLEKECPYVADHDPVNDALSIGWIHISILHELARKRASEASDGSNKKIKVF